MKKLCIIIIAVVTALTFSACYDNAHQSSSEKSTVAETTQAVTEEIDVSVHTNLSGNVEFQDSDGAVIINVNDIKSVQIQINDASGFNDYSILFTFTDEGAQKFSDFTTLNEGEVLNVTVDGEIISSPIINEPITDGVAVIEGNFTAEEVTVILNKIIG